MRENIERSNSSQQRAGHFRISSGISKPRHVFVFIINDANIDAQTTNPFLYNTFSVSTDPRTLFNCHLEVGNGNEYPEIQPPPQALSRMAEASAKRVTGDEPQGTMGRVQTAGEAPARSCVVFLARSNFWPF